MEWRLADVYDLHKSRNSHETNFLVLSMKIENRRILVLVGMIWSVAEHADVGHTPLTGPRAGNVCGERTGPRRSLTDPHVKWSLHLLRGTPLLASPPIQSVSYEAVTDCGTAS